MAVEQDENSGLRQRTRAAVIHHLGAALAFASPGSREHVVAAALGIRDEYHRAGALAGFGAGLTRLSKEQRGRLIAAALGIGNEEFRVHALVGLGVGVAAMRWRS